MVHPCAACSLRFATTGELSDHIRTDHVIHPVEVEPHEPPASRARQLPHDSFTRSGWVVE